MDGFKSAPGTRVALRVAPQRMNYFAGVGGQFVDGLVRP